MPLTNFLSVRLLLLKASCIYRNDRFDETLQNLLLHVEKDTLTEVASESCNLTLSLLSNAQHLVKARS